MDTYYLTLVLYLILIYWFIVVVLDRKGILERYNISAYGPILMIRTLRGQEFLDSMAKGEQRKRFWRIYANIGTVLVLIAMVFMVVLIVSSVYLTFLMQPEPTELHEPRNLLLIPVLNEFIPMCAWIGFVVALVVHEFSHAILSVVERIKVKSMGLLVLVVPIGAFAEPDSEQLFGKKEEKGKDKAESTLEPAKAAEDGKSKKIATSRERTRILSAGVTSNFCVALIAFVLFFGILFSIQPVSDTVLYVYDVAEGSPAEKYGIAPETFITKIDGSKTMGVEGLNLMLKERGETSLTILDKTSKEREILVIDGTEREGVAIVWVGGGTPAANAGMNDGMCIIRMDNKSITGHNDFHEFMNHTLPGQEIEVQTGGETFIVNLAKSPYYANRGYLGISIADNPLGMTVVDFSITGYLHNLRGVSHSLLALSPRGWLMLTILPFGTLDQGGFSTFNPLLSHFYEPVGMASLFGESIFFIADILFWIGWINFYVGLFNCLPAIPLDGGYVFREMLNSVLGVGIKDKKKKEKVSMAIVSTVAVLILIAIVFMIVSPYVFRFFAAG